MTTQTLTKDERLLDEARLSMVRASRATRALYFDLETAIEDLPWEARRDLINLIQNLGRRHLPRQGRE